MQINIELRNHEGRMGHGYRGLIAKDVNGNDLLADISGVNVVDFIESAVQEGVKRIIANNGAAESFTVSITGITLTAGAQTSLSDRFTSDPLVNSLTFA